MIMFWGNKTKCQLAYKAGGQKCFTGGRCIKETSKLGHTR